METLELTDTERELFAIAASNVAGGRHAFRVSDETIKSEATKLVADVRRKRRNSARRESYKWRNVGERFAFDIGYSETETAKIDAWQTILKSRPHSEEYMRDIARALFAPTKFARKHSDAEDIDAYRAIVLTDWRATVRAYSAWRDAVAEIGMTIPLSLADMRADHGSRFYNYAVRKWNAAGYQTFMFGADVSDTFQTAMLNCLESGDWTGKEHRPAYGALWRHIAIAVRRAIWQNTRFAYDSPEIGFSWEEWEKTANAGDAAIRFTATGDRQSLAEWAEYDEWRAMRDATRATIERINSERETRLAMLDAGRKAIAQLVMSGMTLTRIAHVLGRTVDGLASDLDGDEMRPAMRFLPRRQRTESEIAESARIARVQATHAANLRMAYRDMQADNYANGRIFRKAVA